MGTIDVSDGPELNGKLSIDGMRLLYSVSDAVQELKNFLRILQSMRTTGKQIKAVTAAR